MPFFPSFASALCLAWFAFLSLAAASRFDGLLQSDKPIEKEPFKSAPLPALVPDPMDLPSPARSVPGSFRIIALPPNFTARGINNRGQIVGTWDTGRQKDEQNPITKAAVWQKGKLRIFPAPDAQPDCSGTVINDNGLVGGKAGEDGGEPYWAQYDAVLWNAPRPVAHNIGHLSALSFAFISALNNRGQAVGVSEPGYFGESRPYLTPDLQAIDQTNGFFWNGRALLNLGRGAAYGINGRGQVVGTQNGKIVLWSGSEKRILGDGVGYAINNRGQILVYLSGTRNGVVNANLAGMALLYKETVTRLGTLTAGENSTAASLNDRGEVVGKSYGIALGEFDKSRAFLWRNGTMYDLNCFLPPHSGWLLRDARAINNKGQIIGTGTFKGRERSFLLTPR